MNKKNNRKGFTIVELVIVIAVIAILATVLVPTFGEIIGKANESKLLQTLKNEYTSYTVAYANSATFSDDIYILYEGTYYAVTDGVPSTNGTTTAPTAEGTIIWTAADNSTSVVTTAA